MTDHRKSHHALLTDTDCLKLDEASGDHPEPKYPEQSWGTDSLTVISPTGSKKMMAEFTRM